MQPENKHGDDRNITVSEFKAASKSTRVAPGTTKKALGNMTKTLAMRKRK